MWERVSSREKIMGLYVSGRHSNSQFANIYIYIYNYVILKLLSFKGYRYIWVYNYFNLKLLNNLKFSFYLI